MINVRRAWFALLPVFLTVGACSDSEITVPVDIDGPLSSAVQDPVNDDLGGFSFLPPIGTDADTDTDGTFDPTLSPVVEVCETVACDAVHASFSTSGAGAERVRIDEEDEHYIVNWSTRRTDAATGQTYRIRIILDGTVLGHADVRLFANARLARDAGDEAYLARVRGSTIPIKFRIEEGMELDDRFRIVDQLDLTEGTLHYNPLDPVIATVPSGDGEVIQYLADKDEGGVPQRVTGFSTFHQDDPEAEDQVILDDQGRVALVLLADGSHVALEYLEESEVKMTVTATDGTSVVTFFDLDDGSTMSDASGDTSAETRTLSSSDAYAAMEAWRSRPPSTSGSESVEATESDVGTVRVALRAGSGGTTAPVPNALVSGSWYAESGGDIVRHGRLPWGYTNGSGVYYSDLPLEPATTSQNVLDATCSVFDEVLKVPCAAVSLLEKPMTAACAIIPARVPGAPGLKLFGVCVTAVQAIARGCKSLDVCTILREALDNVIRGERLDIFVTASGPALVELTVGDQKTFHQPYPTRFDFDLLVPVIVQLYTVPEQPAPFEAYVATTEINPAFQGIPVSTSMWGTDGYSQSGSGHTDARGMWGMVIPGGEPGVTDMITTEILGVTRTTSFVF